MALNRADDAETVRQAFADASAIMAHPRFGEAVDALIDGLANLYGDDRRLIRTLFEYEHAVTFGIIVCVAANSTDNDPASWISVATVSAGAAQMGIGPARRIRRILDEFRADGLLLAEPWPDDARRHRLIPSERMLAIDREWLAVFHAPPHILAPDEVRFAAGAARDTTYHQRNRRVGLHTLAKANEVMRKNPSIDLFMHKVAGTRVLALLLQAARGNADNWTPAGFYSDAAARSATTRVHVRSLMRLAEQAGLVELDGDASGRVRVSDELIEAFGRWAADCMLCTDLVSAHAMLGDGGIPPRINAGGPGRT